MGFTKLFSTIVTSTIWREDAETCKVWITLLALADFNGHTEVTIPGLAHLADVPLEKCEEALQKFQSPDPYSRSKDFDGRRIEQTERGWRLLNHRRYRDHVDRRYYQREYMRKYREKKSVNITVNNCEHQLAQTDTDTDKEKKINKRKAFCKPSPAEAAEYAKSIGYILDGQQFVDFYDSKDWMIGKNRMKDWKAAVRTWSRTAKPSKLANPEKTKLFPISGKVCGVCAMPAIYKSAGEFDHYYCGEHMPSKVKERYTE